MSGQSAPATPGDATGGAAAPGPVPAPGRAPAHRPAAPVTSPAPVGRQPRPSGRVPRRLHAVPDRTATSASPVVPGVRRLPVPTTDPEPVAPWRRASTDRAVGEGQGTLALVFGASAGPQAAADPLVAARPTGDGDLPDPQATCGALAAAVVEVLSGHRPAAQLVRWMTCDVHTALRRRAALAARLRTDRRGQRSGRRAVVRRVSVCRPADGVVEAAAVVVDGERVRAVALRLEGWDGRWRATAVEVG